MSGDYFVGHEALAKAVEESRAKEQENLQALLRVARAAEKFVDLIGNQLHIPVSDEEKKVKQALKEAEHLLG